jgi:hypothetical protein
MTSGFSGFSNRVVMGTTACQALERGLLCTSDRVVEAMADDATIELLVRAGDPILHMIPSINFTGTATLAIFEAPTVTDPGTAQPIFNRNRNASYVAAVTVFHTPTLSDNGLEIDTLLVGGGSGGQASGADGQFRTEWLLKPNTDYFFLARNIAGNQQSGHLHLDFWEEPTTGAGFGPVP